MKTYKITVRDGATCKILGTQYVEAPNKSTAIFMGERFRDTVVTAALNGFIDMKCEPDDVYWDYEEVKTDVKGK